MDTQSTVEAQLEALLLEAIESLESGAFFPSREADRLRSKLSEIKRSQPGQGWPAMFENVFGSEGFR